MACWSRFPIRRKAGRSPTWDSTFALVLGNEVSGDRSWQGLIKFVAIHSRSMTPAQVLQNFNAGVGERYYMLFDVATVTGVSQSYIMLTVSQYDSYSYLFYQPTFISLDPTVTSSNLPSIPVQGIRIGINGTIPQVGQAYIPLNTTMTAGDYTPQGEVLSNIGTVIGLQAGPLTDQFFLTFDELGSQSDVVVEAIPTAPAPSPGPVVSDVGVKTFAQINATLSALTGVPTTDANVNATYLAVQQQLPPIPTHGSILVGEPGRHRPARHPVLQRGGQYSGLSVGVVAGRNPERRICSRLKPEWIRSPVRSRPRCWAAG